MARSCDTLSHDLAHHLAQGACLKFESESSWLTVAKLAALGRPVYSMCSYTGTNRSLSVILLTPIKK